MTTDDSTNQQPTLNEDDDVYGIIQFFTGWMAKRGYHVVGGILGNSAATPGKKDVKIFSTSAMDTNEAMQSEAIKMLRLMLATIEGTIPATHKSERVLPLTEN